MLVKPFSAIVRQHQWRQQGITALCRARPEQPLDQVHYVPLGSNWHRNHIGTHIQAGDCIVHLAGRAHQGSASQEEETQLQLAAHLTLTQEFAHAAATQKARRFIYISSAKVFAECSHQGAFDNQLRRPLKILMLKPNGKLSSGFKPSVSAVVLS